MIPSEIYEAKQGNRSALLAPPAHNMYLTMDTVSSQIERNKCLGHGRVVLNIGDLGVCRAEVIDR